MRWRRARDRGCGGGAPCCCGHPAPQTRIHARWAARLLVAGNSLGAGACARRRSRSPSARGSPGRRAQRFDQPRRAGASSAPWSASCGTSGRSGRGGSGAASTPSDLPWGRGQINASSPHVPARAEVRMLSHRLGPLLDRLRPSLLCTHHTLPTFGRRTVGVNAPLGRAGARLMIQASTRSGLGVGSTTRILPSRVIS